MSTRAALQPLSLSVAALHQETLAALRVVFEPLPALSYKSGQFLTLILSITGKEHRRCYSLCSSPQAAEAPAIVIKRTKGGLVSNHLCDTLAVGHRLRSLQPMGNFTTDYKANRQRRYLFVAAGSGITPLFSLMQAILYEESGAQLHLIYANRSEKDIILAKGLSALQKRYADRLQLQHVLKQGAAQLPGSRAGRLDPACFSELLRPYEGELRRQLHVFLCTPPSLQASLLTQLRAMDVPAAHIRKESFTAGETSPSEVLLPSAAQEVTLRFAGKDHKVKVDVGQSLLAAGVAAGLDLPYSCQRGVCATCRGQLLQGSIEHIRRPDGLSKDELAEGYILCCQARPTSSNLLVEVE